MKITIELPIEIEVEFEAYKAEPRTRHYPGDPAHLEMVGITLPDAEKVYDEFEDEIKQECWDAIEDDVRAGAEARFESMHEEKLLRGL